jgi:hypothetical protein
MKGMVLVLEFFFEDAGRTDPLLISPLGASQGGEKQALTTDHWQLYFVDYFFN